MATVINLNVEASEWLVTEADIQRWSDTSGLAEQCEVTEADLLEWCRVVIVDVNDYLCSTFNGAT